MGNGNGSVFLENVSANSHVLVCLDASGHPESAKLLRSAKQETIFRSIHIQSDFPPMWFVAHFSSQPNTEVQLAYGKQNTHLGKRVRMRRLTVW